MEQNHSKNVRILSFIEACERFGFYTTQSLLVLYLVTSHKLGGFALNDNTALRIGGYYGSIVFISPIIGGILADKILGRKLTAAIGIIMMMFGNLLLCIPNYYALFISLSTLVLGCGFIKPAITAMIGEIFSANENNKRDAAFSIYYMSIYIGAFLAPIFSGFLQHKYGFSTAFLTSAIILSTAFIYLISVWHYSLRNIGKLTHTRSSSKKQSNKNPKIVTYLILCISNIFSNAFYVLPYGVLTLYTTRNIDRHIFGFEIPVAWYLGFHTLCVIIFSFLVASLYNNFGNRYNSNITLSIKLAIGYIILALALLVIIPFITQVQNNPSFVGSQIYLIAFYTIFALNKTFNTPSLLSAANAFATPDSAARLAAYNMAISWGVGYWVGSEIIIYFNRLLALSTLLYWSIGLCIVFAIAHIATNRRIEQVLHSS